MPPTGSPPKQTPEMDQDPTRRLWGFGKRMLEGTAADHAAILGPDEDEASSTADSQSETRGNSARIGRGAQAVALLTVLGVAIPGGAEASDRTSSNDAEIEKQALAAFGNNAITRSADSFPAPEAQASAKRGMRPKIVMKRIGKIFEKKQGFLGASGQVIRDRIHLKSASATPGVIKIKGDCDKWDPSSDGYFVRFAVSKPNVQREAGCSKLNDPWFVKGERVAHPKDYFARNLNMLGNTVARSAGVGRRATGRAVRVSANSSKAVVYYRRNTSEQASKRQIRKIVLKQGQPPVEIPYKKQAR